MDNETISGSEGLQIVYRKYTHDLHVYYTYQILKNGEDATNTWYMPGSEYQEDFIENELRRKKKEIMKEHSLSEFDAILYQYNDRKIMKITGGII